MERIIAATPRVLLGLAFVAIGSSKFESNPSWNRLSQQIGLGDWFRLFTGALQCLGGVLAVIPRTTLIGAALIACTMASAVSSICSSFTAVPPQSFRGRFSACAAGVAWQAWNREPGHPVSRFRREH